MRLSLLMTVRDGERFLAQALTSAISQSTPPDEIVVVNDGSTDGTPDVLRTFGSALRVHHLPPQGIATSLNVALVHSRHELVGYLDADDLLPPDSLQVRAMALREQPHLAAVGGRMLQFTTLDGDADEHAYRLAPDPVSAGLVATLLLRRKALTRVGPLDESLPVMAQVDWVARARCMGLRIGAVDAVVLHRRVHGANTTLLRKDEMQMVMFEIVRRQRARALAHTLLPQEPPNIRGPKGERFMT